MMILAILLAAQAQLPSPVPVPAHNVDPPEVTFSHRCSVCHGQDGRGKTPHGITAKAPDFTTEAWQKHITDEQIIQTITNGKPGTRMNAFGGYLSPAEIASLVPYLRAFGRTQSQPAGR
jgi:mono/diheme cytochrome c family protein